MADARGIASPSTARQRLEGLSWKNFFGLRTIGFALARAWVYLMFLGFASSAITWNGQAVPGAVFTCSTASLCALLFASAFLPKRFEAFVRRPAGRAAGPVLTAAGTLLVAFMTLPGAPQAALGGAGAVLTGVGSGIIDLGYGELYRSIDPKRTAFETPFAFLLAACAVPLVTSLPPQAACLVCSALPLASGVILFRHLKAFAPHRAADVQPVPMHVGRFAWRIGACACLVGCADGVVRAVFMTVNATAPESFYRFPIVWSSLLAVCIIYGCALFAREDGLRPMYRSVVLCMALFFMLLPVLTGFSELESVIALTGYGTFNVLIWLVLADAAFNFRFSSIVVFGIGWGMTTLGVLLGSHVGRAVCLLAPFSPQTISLIALLATLAILVSYMFVFKESDLIALAKGEEDAASEATGAQVEADAGAPADRGAAAGAEAGGSELGAGEPRRRRFQDRCADVAAEYGLSPKETEIMILFAKGRSGTRIQEELYLSRGTVTTHLRHIYQKMDVHNKQEFLDVIEGCREEG